MFWCSLKSRKSFIIKFINEKPLSATATLAGQIVSSNVSCYFTFMNNISTFCFQVFNAFAVVFFFSSSFSPDNASLRDFLFSKRFCNLKILQIVLYQKVFPLHLTIRWASFPCSWKIFTCLFPWNVKNSLASSVPLDFYDTVSEMSLESNAWNTSKTAKSVISEASWTSTINLFKNSMAICWWKFVISICFSWLRKLIRPSWKSPIIFKKIS